MIKLKPMMKFKSVAIVVNIKMNVDIVVVVVIIANLVPALLNLLTRSASCCRGKCSPLIVCINGLMNAIVTPRDITISPNTNNAEMFCFHDNIQNVRHHINSQDITPPVMGSHAT